ASDSGGDRGADGQHPQYVERDDRVVDRGERGGAFAHRAPGDPRLTSRARRTGFSSRCLGMTSTIRKRKRARPLPTARTNQFSMATKMRVETMAITEAKRPSRIRRTISPVKRSYCSTS